MPTYQEYEQAAIPTGMILTESSWNKMTDVGRQRLLDTVSGKLKPLLTYDELAARLSIAEAEIADHPRMLEMTHDSATWAMQDQLEEARARLATLEAEAAENGKKLADYESASSLNDTRRLLALTEAQRDGLRQELAEQEREKLALVQNLDRAGQSGVCIQQLALNGVITTEQCEEMMQALSSEDWHEYHRLPGSALTRRPKSAPASPLEGEAGAAGLSGAFDDGWYPKEVFDSAADYDTSVENVAGRIASGEVKPIEQQGRIDCPGCEEPLAWDNAWIGTGSTCKYCGYPGPEDEKEPPAAPLERKAAAEPQKGGQGE